MTKEQVIAVLAFYRECDMQIREYRWEIADLENQYYNSATSQSTGEGGGGGGNSSVVERMAMRSIDNNASKEIVYLERKIDTIRSVRLEIRKELDGLSPLHRRIVMQFYIEGLHWTKIAGQAHFSVRQCRRIRDDALGKLSIRFQNNRIISGYKFPKK